MTIETALVKNNLVMRDSVNAWRWYDAFGPEVRKWVLDHTVVVSTTTATGSIVTQTNGTLVATDSTTGGAITLTMAAGDNNICTVQSHSEAFKFASPWPAYYGCKFQLVDPPQTDFFAGWCIKNTTLEAGMTDGIYFRLVDESAVLSLVLEQDSAETTVEVATLVAATDYMLELYHDGDYVYAYINGVLATTVATSNANFCNDEDLCATFGVQTGEASANNARLYWARAIQVQNA
jgi:hypothetical protein